ncbi:glycoside hydrolase family 2 protein [Streptosporangium sp. NPDC006013]|uniref:glycoside hydrolase family 2 protein n=1 Tax=Streptosporangium sp. NPDC006013 TaxID=3155596 RepID=UPI0033BEDC0B
MSLRATHGDATAVLVPPVRWTLLATPPDQVSDPGGLPDSGWLPAEVPGTVAAAARRWPEPVRQRMASLVADADEHDWWYRCTVPEIPDPDGGVAVLTCAGLASLAEVWVNGQRVLRSDNMHLEHKVDVTGLLDSPHTELTVCFRALAPLLASRRPRPRWTTRLVDQQQLRRYRTTLLGRIPGWSPGPPPVGPWRPIELTLHRRLVCDRPRLVTTVDGAGGIVTCAVPVRPVAGRSVVGGLLHVGGHTGPLRMDGPELVGRLRVPEVELWHPHTHGSQPRYPVVAELEFDDGITCRLPLGDVGFREVTPHGPDEMFPLRHNGMEVFFRGGCWTPLDVTSLTTDEDSLLAALRQMRDAGANMVRVCGPMVYEADAFYDACDELGIAVWQDFMFANMDYPVDDEEFAASVRQEAQQILTRLSAHPCLTVVCGNSEVAQQAALAGAPPELWHNKWFEHDLRELCRVLAPGVPYRPSSPSGGALPVHVDTGDAHYYGVGAYLRDFDDVRVSRVRFASECLAFANVPEPRSLERFFGPRTPAVHDPRWKAASPRDGGAGWDFDDIRDEYLRRVFRIDPLATRYAEPVRYLDLARATTGEVMARVFGQWRTPDDPCGGGLVWFWRDVLPGAGWGVVDVDGHPKAAYYYLKRAWRHTAVFLHDRGLNGLRIVAVRDRLETIDATVRLLLYPRDAATPRTVERGVRLSARRAVDLSADELVGGFRDLNAAYRFGPIGLEAIAVELLDDRGRLLADDVFFPDGLPNERRGDLDLSVTVRRDASGPSLVVGSTRPAYAVHVDIAGHVPDDNYFHVMPGRTRVVRLRPGPGRAGVTGCVRALNAHDSTSFALAHQS